MAIIMEISGVSDVNQMLKDIKELIADPKVPVTQSAQMYVDKISRNFKDKGSTFGEPWQPLSPATIRIKRQLYQKGKAVAVETPLIRTGKLSKSFYYKTEGNNVAIIDTSEPQKAVTHQFGGMSTINGKKYMIPKRILIAIRESEINDVVNIFINWLSRHIK